MSISIIIPARNEQVALPALLDSIVNQTMQPDQVIVVDSNSTDATAELALGYAAQLPLIVHTATEKGVVAARNQGMNLATKDMILFIDSDATIPADFIKNMMKEIATRKLTIGGFKQQMPSKLIGLRAGAQLMNVYARIMAHSPWPIFFSCFFVTNKLHMQIGEFDPELYIMEDYDYALRGKRAGGEFGIINSTHFIASPRRYETDDTLKGIAQGIYGELYRYTHGLRVTKPIYEYKMGGKKTSKK